MEALSGFLVIAELLVIERPTDKHQLYYAKLCMELECGEKSLLVCY